MQGAWQAAGLPFAERPLFGRVEFAGQSGEASGVGGFALHQTGAEAVHDWTANVIAELKANQTVPDMVSVGQ